MFISSFFPKSFEYGFLPVTVGSLNILLYFTLGILQLFFHFVTKLNLFCELKVLVILITGTLNSPSDMFAIPSSLSSVSEVLLCSFTWALFLCLGAPTKL